ncbi:bleomycin hydrolase-like [Portunus trituberculatus]|uniref:bleomycin hydrolase-like n=1 Tax=Portunus trituberculatus TaxID=210409 RepID=UPI001E1CEABE|nr:bleomycin hydrolase-like [Portunus trituberculatus]XP_045103003.1 bleomycin hydrolase-like [Portunus trituberculatus]XP_045103004.1 bleomycin hydrolase-like [Portunus trituberculatus]
MALTITPELMDQYRTEVQSEPSSCLAMNACFKSDPLEMCMCRCKVMATSHVFTHKVESEGRPVTNQKSSGRCWIFAALNVMRLPFIKQYNLEEFEFSQAYLFYMDKLERCNYFLNKMVECAKRGEEVEGRLLSFLLHDPIVDGGQWDMFVNLITRYGVMPKKYFPESYSAENSMRMNRILQSKLREYTRELRAVVSKDGDESTVVSTLTRQMKEIYRIVSICLGIPPETFTWEYYDKSKTYHKIGPITPLEFYNEYVKPVYNVEDKVCLVTDPRPNNAYGHAYTVDCLGNMVGGRSTIYNNQPVEMLMNLTSESIKNGEAVWFGCEVAKRFAGKLGIQDLEVHNYKSVFGVEVNLGLSKADRLLYGESLMTHAMVFTATTLNESGSPEKWRVENSWGEDRGEKGYLLMTSEWFREFVFETVVDKKYVPEEVLAVFNQEPIVLPAWDPMGALARDVRSQLQF